MNGNWIVVALGCFAVSGFGEDLKALAAKSREEAKACAAHIEPIQAAAGTPVELNPNGDFVFSSKETALKVLGLLPGYPGQPKSSGLLVQAIAKSKPAELYPLFNLGDCKTIGYYGLHKNLITSAAHYGFSAEEKKKVASLTLLYVKQDISSPLTLLDVMTRMAVVEQLGKKGIVALSPEKKAKLDALKLKAEQARQQVQKADWSKEAGPLKSEADFRKLKPETQKLLFDSILVEMKLSDGLRDELGKITSDLVY